MIASVDEAITIRQLGAAWFSDFSSGTDAFGDAHAIAFCGHSKTTVLSDSDFDALCCSISDAYNVRAWIRSMKMNQKDLYFFTYVNSENEVSIDRSLNRAMRGDFCGPAAYGTRETWPQEQVSDPRTTFRGTWQMRELRVHRSLEQGVRDEPGSKVKFVLTRWSAMRPRWNLHTRICSINLQNVVFCASVN